MIRAIESVLLRNFATFSGRACRAEYWWWYLFMAVGFPVLLLLSAVLLGGIGILIMAAFYLVVIIPSLAVFVRRLHDTDRSGWWWLIAFVPIVGALVLLLFTVTAGTNGPNRFGPKPEF